MVAEDLGLPNLSEGQQPEELLMTYVNGLMARSTKMSDLLGKVEAIKEAPESLTKCLALSCLLCSVRVHLSVSG